VVWDTTARALARRLALEQSRSRLPSIVAGVLRDGRLVWFGSSGEIDGSRPDEETQYRCGSISKTFIAVEVMRLRDEGMVGLDEPIEAYVPGLAHLGCTVAQLLSHTSGIRADTSGPWWERTPGVAFDSLLSSSLRDVDVLDRPGRRFHYSNVGFAVLGELIHQGPRARLGRRRRHGAVAPARHAPDDDAAGPALRSGVRRAPSRGRPAP
jgi:CubicO group peptidase (beta-lactamase class C family)